MKNSSLRKIVFNVITAFWISMWFTTSVSAVCTGSSIDTWNTVSDASLVLKTGDVQSDEQDYYTIVVTADGTINMTVSNTDTQWDLDATLYNSDCTSALWGTTTVTPLHSVATGNISLLSGTYIMYLAGEKSNKDTTYSIEGTFSASSTAPVMSPIPYQSFVDGTPYSLNLSTFVTELDGDVVTYSVLGVPGVPSWLSLDSATGILSGTPDSNGTFTLTATATDVDGADSESFTLSSTAGTTTPVMGDVPNQGLENGAAYTLDISPYVTLGDSAIVSYSLGGTIPSGLVFNSTTGILSGAATVNGNYPMTVSATDVEGDTSNIDDFNISVLAPGVESDLLIYKSSTALYGQPGDEISYTISIANPTNSTINNIDFTDLLTVHTYDEATGTTGSAIPGVDLNVSSITIEDGGNSFSCTPSGTPVNTINCTGGSLGKAKGNGFPKIERFRYTITVPNVVPAVLYNEVTIDGTTTDANRSVIVPSAGGGVGITTPPPTHVDVIEGGIWTGESDYNAGTTKYIMTKKSGESGVLLTAVHLNESSEAVPFVSTNGQVYEAIPYISNATCSSYEPLIDDNTGLPLRMIIPSGATTVDAVTTMPNYANRENRLYLTYFDYDQLYSDTGGQCFYNSSTTGNLAGMPQCINSEQKYYNTFGFETFERCQSGNGSPCNSTNHGYSCGGGNTCDGYNAAYDNALGCLMCTLNVLPDCSTDNFALRPDEYNITSIDNSYPDLMRAAKDYNLTIIAEDDNSTTNTFGYNQIGASVNAGSPVQYDANGNIVSLPGSAVLSTGFVFTNGITTTPAQYTYTEVGDISIHLEDQNWSYVDINNPVDLTPTSCVANGAYICGDLNTTFIPDHFKVIVDLNNSSNGFTYLSNDQNMSAMFNVQIFAENEDNATTLNFSEFSAGGNLLFENPITAIITIPDHPTMGTIVKNEITVPTLVGFNLGTKTLSSTDSNASLALWFHYARATNVPVNPFILHGNDVVVDVNSTYPATGTAVALEGTAVITGTDSDDANITYVYGRTHMARTRAMCNTSPCAGNVTFFYEFYGDKGAADYNQTLISNLLGTSPKRSLDSVNWYRNTLHNTATDGNVTYSTQNIPGDTTKTSAGFTHSTQTTSASYSYDGSKGYPYKGTVHVPSSPTGGTQSWLIYDKYASDPATEMRGELEYYGPGSWSSNTGAAESVNDSSGKKNRNTNRRIRW